MAQRDRTRMAGRGTRPPPGRSTEVETDAGRGEPDVHPVLLVRVVGSPSARAVDVEVALANAAGDGLAVDHVERHVQPEVGVPLVDDELVQRLAARGVAGQQVEVVQSRSGYAGASKKRFGRRRVEALGVVGGVISGHPGGKERGNALCNAVLDVFRQLVTVDRLRESEADLRA